MCCSIKWPRPDGFHGHQDVYIYMTSNYCQTCMAFEVSGEFAFSMPLEALMYIPVEMKL